MFFCFCFFIFLFYTQHKILFRFLMSKTQRVRVLKETNLKTQHNEPRLKNNVVCLLSVCLSYVLFLLLFMHFSVATPYIR